MKNNVKKVAVGMSGGVDSSVAALLLKQQGYEVIGIFMKFWVHNGKTYENSCCSAQSKSDARRVAEKIGIPLYTLNLKTIFKDKVVDNFIKSYGTGKTPNPCILCNKYIKFGEFYKKARALGCDYIATGHYAESRVGRLYQAKDFEKDQSYFLYTLKEKELQQILFPLAKLTKNEVRKIAEKNKLLIFNKPESQDICFVPDNDYRQFLKSYLKPRPGKILDLAKNILGEHTGLPNYTLGQRTGLNITNGQGPYFVLKIDQKNNVLVVSNDPQEAQLLEREFWLKNVSWVNDAPKKNFTAQVKVRYSREKFPAQIEIHKSQVKIILKKPLRAITPGQHGVIYQKTRVLGGGEIS